MGCADSKIDDLLGCGGSASFGLLEGINLAPPFPLCALNVRITDGGGEESEPEFYFQGFVKEGRVKISKFQEF